MKTSCILSLVVALSSAALVQAAPTIKANEISPEALKAIATPTQAASLQIAVDAKAAAEADRLKQIKAAKAQTADNDAGMKKTILRRTLNNMLPACEREPEAPRVPSKYEVR